MHRNILTPINIHIIDTYIYIYIYIIDTYIYTYVYKVTEAESLFLSSRDRERGRGRQRGRERERQREREREKDRESGHLMTRREVGRGFRRPGSLVTPEPPLDSVKLSFSQAEPCFGGEKSRPRL